MSDLSTYLGNKVLRWMAGNAFPSAPANCYLALFNGDPKAAGTEVTLSIDATGRKSITFDAIAAGTDNVLTNAAAVDFGEAEAAVSLSHVAVYDDPTAGNLLWTRALPGGPYAISLGTPVSFDVGNITFTCGD